MAVQAQIELGFERFLEEKNYQAIVTHFGDLGSLKQLPGLAIQRLEEKGYVERTINKNDRRNTYVELTAEGKKQTSAVQREMRDFGKTVMAKLDEQEMNQLILYLNNIYSIAEKELEARKIKDRKEREHE